MRGSNPRSRPPLHPSCLSRVCSKTGRLLLCRLPGLRANAARPGFGVPECSGTPGSGRRTSGPPPSPERPNNAETVGAGLCSARRRTQHPAVYHKTPAPWNLPTGRGAVLVGANTVRPFPIGASSGEHSSPLHFCGKNRPQPTPAKGGESF